ncbi:MAG TPA: TonB-dependent receptor [Gemmatimonadaceae bacterium]|nr:TonB-dependent receptor [Gemmatimonadaceae bacterium]
MRQSKVKNWLHLAIAFVAIAPMTIQAQGSSTVTGSVTERGSSTPLQGAQVSIPGTGLGAAVNSAGSFTIRGVAPGSIKVRAQMIGYEPIVQTVQVPASGSVTVTFAMTRTATTLSGVVVTATGEESRRSIGTALATIDTLQITRSAALNPQDILTGTTPGVTVLANGGQPGSGGSILLRGVNSVSQGNSPLVYIDGVRVFNGHTPTNVGGRQYINPLNDLPAESIDHIEIVKGPAATTLYGTEASGGVLQIFTKQGKSGAPVWSLAMTGGFNSMGHVGPESDPTGQFFNNCSGILTIGNGTKFQDATCPSSGSWLHKGGIARLNLGVRGGTSNGITYQVSGNADSEDGVLPTGGVYNRGFRANLGFTPARGLTINVNQSVARLRTVGFADGNSANGAVLNISRGSGSNYKGTGCTDLTVVCVINDSLFTNDIVNVTNHFLTGATLTYQPTEALTNRFAVGFDYNDADLRYIVPFGNVRVPLGSMFQTLWQRQFLTADYAGTIRRQLGRSLSTSTSVGAQVFESRIYSTDFQSDNFAAPGDPTLVSGSTRLISAVTQQRVINAGLFAQELVGWRDILFVTAGIRRDGNSAFGKGFGFQTYPKLSASYVISDERFWPRLFVQTLKLRAAVGESGKAPGAFDAVRTWSPVAAENGKPGFTTNTIGNENLGPERTREVELGFDATALGGRLNVEYSHFDAHTYEALIPVQQSPSLGFSGSQLINVGELMSSGHEVMLNMGLVRLPSLDITGRLGFSKVHSEAGYIGGQVLTIFALGRTFVKEGLPVPSYYGLKVMNPNALANPIIEDGHFLGSVYPTRTWTPGINARFFNHVTFDAQGEWQIGGHTLNAVGYQNANLFAWQPCYAAQDAMRTAAAGDSTALGGFTALERARCTINTKIARDYSFWVEKADFFKLRSMSLTFDLPTKVLPGARSASLAIAGRNLWKSSKYTGTDPENADTRDDTFARRDYYVFPGSRSFTMTLRMGF